MKSFFLSLLTAIALSAPSLAVSEWGQCGGISFTGSTTCDSGLVCTVLNPYYYQCLPGTATTTSSPITSTPPPTTAPPTTTTTPPPTTVSTAPTPTNSLCSGSLTKFKFFGVNESGGEFGTGSVPGVLGTDYTWPSPSSIDFFMGKGFNTFRIPFLMERMSPPATGLTGAFDATYLSGLKTIVSYITGKGGYALVDPHNFMIYNGATITSTSEFQTWWTNLAAQFISDSHVVFDIMNEPHDIPAQTVYELNQAAVNGIRASGATTQLILAEGTSYTGAWTWVSSGNGAAFTALTDPNNNIAIEMHQYLDSDGSGTSPTCVSDSIGASRLEDATQWLQQNNFKGFLGEMGAGNNTDCITAVQGALCSMQQTDVWLGMLWWAAGPWWGDYFQSMEPPSGAAVAQVLPQALEPFL